MNSFEHQLKLRSPVGDLLDVISDEYYAGMTYTFKENEPGVLELALPGDYDRRYLKIDAQIEINRSVNGGSLRLEGDTAFFIRKVEKGEDANGVETINVLAYSALDICRRRIVAYYAGSSYTEKQAMYWDDMMREIMRENYGTGASFMGASYSGEFIDGDADRNLEPWLIVEPDVHYGASYTHSMPWARVLQVLQEIANDVRSQGFYCTFDVVWVSPAHYEFKIFIGLRGHDHSADSSSPVIISKERNNLANPHYDEDWQDEHNFIYATGQGQNDQRVVKTAQDDNRINISPFNRQEFNQEARQATLEDSVLAEASAGLEENRPKRHFSGEIVQTEGCVYGVHWGWGDIVTAEYDGQNFDCHVTTVTVSIDSSGTEIVTGQLRSVEDVT